MPSNHQVSTKPQNLLPDIFTIWQQNKFWILLIGLLSTLLVVGIASLLPPKYKATTQIYIDPRDLQVLTKQVTPQLKSQNIGTTLVETQVLILQSDRLLKEIIRQYSLQNDPEFNGSSKNPLKTALNWIMPAKKTVGTVDPMSLPLLKLKKAIDVHRIDRSYVVEATIKTWSREKSHTLLKGLVSAFLKYQSSSRADMTSRMKKELAGGTNNLQSDVARLEKDVELYKQKYNLTGIGGQMVSEQQIANINRQLAQIRVSNAKFKARLDKIPANASTIATLPEALSSQTIRSLRIALSRAIDEKARLNLRFFSGHPTMRASIEKEKNIKQQIKDEIGRIRGGLLVEYKRSKQNEKLLMAEFKNLQRQLNTANKAQIGLRELERKLSVSQQAYQTTISRIREAGELARINTANIQVISPPHAPQSRVFPPSKSLLAVIGFLFGLVAAFAWLHLRYYTLFSSRETARANAKVSQFPNDYFKTKNAIKRLKT